MTNDQFRAKYGKPVDYGRPNERSCCLYCGQPKPRPLCVYCTTAGGPGYSNSQADRVERGR